MQKHEGPRRKRETEERSRQWVLTLWLSLAILLLGEQLRLFHLVGYALVLAGVVIASRRASAKKA